MKPFLNVVLAVLLLGSINTLFAVPKKPEPCGSVVTVNGQATVKSKQLAAGGPIFASDEVITGENSAVKFLMVDKSIIDLGASTSFKFDDYRDGENESRQADLSLEFGTVRASVTKKLDEKSKFHIRTKSSVLAVRGTEFLAKWETREGKVTEQVTVGSGKVEMNTGGRTLALNPGNQYNATGSLVKSEQGSGGNSTGSISEEKPALKGEVTTLPPEKISETLKEAKAEDKTFSDTVTFEKRSTKDAKKKEDKVDLDESGNKTPKTEGNIEEKKVAKDNKGKDEKGAEDGKQNKTDSKNTAERKPANQPKTAAERNEENSPLDMIVREVAKTDKSGNPIIATNGIPPSSTPIVYGERITPDKKDIIAPDDTEPGPPPRPPLPPPAPGGTGCEYAAACPPPPTANTTTTPQTINITVKVDGI